MFGAEVAGLRRLDGSGTGNTHGHVPDESLEHQPLPSYSQLELSVRRKRRSSSNLAAEPIASDGNNTTATIESTTISCKYVVAADGAGSSVRAAAGMGLSGKRDLGHLVNIHFTCPELADLLVPDKDGNGRYKGGDTRRRPGMLYFVYNEVSESQGQILEGVWIECRSSAAKDRGRDRPVPAARRCAKDGRDVGSVTCSTVLGARRGLVP